MILGEWGPSPCRAHRATLIDFVDRRERGPSVDLALGHLDACDRCRRELAEVLVAITALRRIADQAGAARPADDVWARIRSRIDRPSAPAWVARVSMGSFIVATAAAAMFLAPSVTPGRSGAILEEAGTDPAAVAAERRATAASDRQIELRFLADRMPGPSLPGPWRGATPRIDPDRGRDPAPDITSSPLARAE
jgi:hypothetical protein